jgi:O-antigen ligase
MLFLGTIACLLIIVITGLKIKFSIALLLLVVFTTFFISNIKYGIVFLLFIRSSTDLITANSIIPNLNVDLSSLVTLYMTILIVMYILINKIHINNNNIITCFVVFISLCIVSSVIPNNYHSGIIYVIKYISILLVYFIVLYFSSNDNSYDEIILKGIIFSSLIPLLFGLYQIVFRTGQKVNTLVETQQGLNRAYGTFVHSNVFAFYLLIIIVAIVLYLLNYQKNKFMFFLLALAIIELYFTYTRGAWLGFIIMVLLGILLSDMSLYYKLFILLILSVLSIPIYGIASMRFTKLFSNKLEESSLATRLYIWTEMYKLFGQRPIFGYGMNSFPKLSKDLLYLLVARENPPEIQAHNDYLKLLIETGIFGLISYLALQISALVKLVRSRRKNFIIVFILLFTFLGMSLGDNINDMTVCEWYLWALVALYTK